MCPTGGESYYRSVSDSSIHRHVKCIPMWNNSKTPDEYVAKKTHKTLRDFNPCSVPIGEGAQKRLYIEE